jgi:LmbE family N-acetylglucosaminyl deacetylase
MNILIVAPHPDDEVLGCGGTIARLAKEKHHVHVAIVTKAAPPLLTEEQVERGRKHALAAHHFLGVKETIFCDFPAAALDQVPHADLNKKLGEIVNRINPDMMFIPFSSDVHLDHQRTFLSSLVAARPNSPVYPKKIYAYETLSETNWNAPYLTSAFHPNAFFDISDYLEMKLKAFSMHEDQVKQFPHERSLQALKALATLRGSTVHREAAEAFLIIREVS